MTRVLLTHTPQARQQYYGERSLRGLQAAAQVVLHEGADALDAAGLIGAARDVDIIVADRLTEGPANIRSTAEAARLRPLRGRYPQRRRRRGVGGGRAGDARRAGFCSIRRRAGAWLDGRPVARGFTRDGGLPRRAKTRDRDGAATRRQQPRHHRLRQHRPISGAARHRPGHGGSGRRSLRHRGRWADQASTARTTCSAAPTTSSAWLLPTKQPKI